MRTTPPGALLKRPTYAGTLLHKTEPYRRLTATLQDLIIIAYQRSTNLPGNSLSLEKLEYANAEKNGEKYSMRLTVLVKDHEADAYEQVNLSITAEVDKCSVPF